MRFMLGKLQEIRRWPHATGAVATAVGAARQRTAYYLTKSCIFVAIGQIVAATFTSIDSPRATLRCPALESPVRSKALIQEPTLSMPRQTQVAHRRSRSRRCVIDGECP
jgi:hypothetical protein